MLTKDEVKRAIDDAKSLAADFGSAQMPVDMGILASRKGVVEISPKQMSADGYLGRREEDGEFVIRYRAGNGYHRNRFTIAHEVAHIILAEVQGKQINSKDAYHRDANEEASVNRIAAELIMPSGRLTCDLTQFESQGERPSWRLVNELSRKYAVSNCAMAFRLLELESVWAISFRINLDGVGPAFPFARSEHAKLWPTNGIEYELDRLWREARRSTFHTIPVNVNGQKEEMNCNGLVKTINSRLGKSRNYWVIGWSIKK